MVIIDLILIKKVHLTDELREKGLKPWFECQNRKDIDLRIIIGHWSTLGFYEDEHVLALDTGCVWGGKLTAARIDSNEVEIVSIECEKEDKDEVENPSAQDITQI